MGKRKENRELEKLQQKQRQDDRRSELGRALLGALLLMGVGVLLVLRPDLGTGTVAMVLGWILIGMGVLTLVVSILSWPAVSLVETLLAVAMAGFGIFILARPEFLGRVLGIGLGIYLTGHGLTSLTLCRKLKKLGFRYLPQLISGLLYLALGITLLLLPLRGALWLIRLVGITLILWGGAGLVLRLLAMKKLHAHEQTVVDAEN